MSRCRLASGLAFATFIATAGGAANAACSGGTLYLTFDTGNMRHAELIADTLDKDLLSVLLFMCVVYLMIWVVAV